MKTLPELLLRNTKQCSHCRGAGYLKATFNLDMKEIEILAEYLPNRPIDKHILRDECPDCMGNGRITL